MIELGTQHRLWGLGSNGVALHSRAVLITAHGVPRLFNSTFTVPAGTTVAFFGAEGVALLDPGFRQAARLSRHTPQEELALAPRERRGLAPYELFGPGTRCPDYSLTKYQGYHSHTTGAIFGILAKPFLGAGAESYTDIDNFLRDNQTAVRQDDVTRDAMDIVTIRYRPGRISTTLSETITVLRSAGYRYEFIMCSFCRGIFGGHDATRNNFLTAIAHE